MCGWRNWADGSRGHAYSSFRPSHAASREPFTVDLIMLDDAMQKLVLSVEALRRLVERIKASAEAAGEAYAKHGQER